MMLTRLQDRHQRGSRRVHVNGKVWLYRVGRAGGVVIYGPNDEHVATHAAHIKGQWAQDFERGQWKRTSDGMLKPRHVKRFIEVGRALGSAFCWAAPCRSAT